MILIPEKSQHLDNMRFMGYRRTVFVSEHMKKMAELYCMADNDLIVLPPFEIPEILLPLQKWEPILK